MDFRIGDMCSVSINGVWSRHYGIVAGFDRRGWPYFIHNTYARGYVAEASFEEFTAGRAIRIDKRARSGTEHEVVRRARGMLHRKYDFVQFNCEHLATYAATGSPSSEQIQMLGIGAAVITVVFGFITFFGGGGGSRA